MTTNQELRKLAEEAENNGPIYAPVAWNGFLAAANPAKVIELLDRIDRLEAQNEAQRKLLEQAHDSLLRLTDLKGKNHG